MKLSEKLLYHQVHPAKLATDFGTAAVGAYLRRYMTHTWEAVRFAGDIVMALGAWWHRPAFIALGLLVIAGAWANGFTRRRSRG